MELDLIGTEVWNCVGCELTPRMRQDILMTTVEMYEEWEASGMSYQRAEDGGGLELSEANPVTTLSDFLRELTGDRHPLTRWNFLDDDDDLYDWLKEYLGDLWGDDTYEEDEEGNDPMLQAEQWVFEWLDGLRIEDVLAWRSDLLNPERRASDWRVFGF